MNLRATVGTSLRKVGVLMECRKEFVVNDLRVAIGTVETGQRRSTRLVPPRRSISAKQAPGTSPYPLN